MQPIESYYLGQDVLNLAIVGIGTFVIWLGYRLFRDMPSRREGETKISLPGGISIFLSRVGPGIFFALFGSAMIAYTAKGQHTFDDGRYKAADNRAFDGAPTPDATSAGALPLKPLEAVRLVRILAGLADEIAKTQAAAAQIDPTQSGRVQVLKEVRAHLMLQAWDPAWGSAEAFAAWAINGGDPGQPPPDAKRAADIFNGASS